MDWLVDPACDAFEDVNPIHADVFVEPADNRDAATSELSSRYSPYVAVAAVPL